MVDIGNLCIECGCDTSYGKGSFVNRIPADDGERIGYWCADCQYNFEKEFENDE